MPCKLIRTLLSPKSHQVPNTDVSHSRWYGAARTYVVLELGNLHSFLSFGSAILSRCAWCLLRLALTTPKPRSAVCWSVRRGGRIGDHGRRVRTRNEFQRLERGGRLLWQVEDRIPNIDTRVLGQGPRFKLQYRGVSWVMIKVVVYRLRTRVVM
jgi:hypothetical protein